MHVLSNCRLFFGGKLIEAFRCLIRQLSNQVISGSVQQFSPQLLIKKKLNIDISDVQYNEHTTLEEVLKNGTVVEAIPDHVVDFIEAKNKLNKGEK